MLLRFLELLIAGQIGIDPSIGMSHYVVELDNNISANVGYSARYRPDFSLKDSYTRTVDLN